VVLSASTENDDCLRLRLFVSGATPRSMRAVGIVRRLCDARVAGHYTLDVIDIYRDPRAAFESQIVAVPTLLKLSPAPKRLFIGDMSDTAPLLAGLGLPPMPQMN
jgi:circadian clock protein KaiB